jgi:hypothetical protein
MKRLTITDVIDLSPDHPLMIEFMKQVEAEETPAISMLDCEESLAYFDRYIAGDR